MKTVVARAKRVGSWWAVEVDVPGATQYTQGRTLGEAQAMAQDVVAIMAAEVDPSLAEAVVQLEIVGSARDIADVALSAQRDAEQARAYAKEAQAVAVSDLLAQGMTMGDVAKLIGVTKGRVSQIAKAA